MTKPKEYKSDTVTFTVERKPECMVEYKVKSSTEVAIEKAGNRQVMIRISSKVVVKFLQTMQKYGYIGDFEIIDDHRSGKIVVELIGRINKCGVISPRFDVCHSDIEQWVVNLLPARQFGHIILTTSLGIMDHEEAKRKQTGGKVLGFFY